MVFGNKGRDHILDYLGIGTYSTIRRRLRHPLAFRRIGRHHCNCKGGSPPSAAAPPTRAANRIEIVPIIRRLGTVQIDRAAPA